jgi:hypothetical protein
MEEGLSIAASIVSIIVGLWGLRSEERAQRERSDRSSGLDFRERIGVVAQIVALICLILAAAAYLFARTADSRDYYETQDTFDSLTNGFALTALVSAALAFTLPLLRGRSSGWPYALFVIPAAGVLMMFAYLLEHTA